MPSPRPVPALLLALLLPVMVDQAAAQLVRSAAPPGFEDLAAPQPAVVDLRYDGERVGVANALLSPGRIVFDDPGAVAAALPGTVDRSAVAAALTGPLPTHPERLCGPGAPPDCGLLQPEVAGVIVDADSFRVDVFVAAPYRERGIAEPRYLAAPRWRPSAVQSFSLAASAVAARDTRAALTARSVLAAGPSRLRADYGFEADEGLFLDELASESEWRRWRLTAGLGRTSAVPLLSDRRFAGARLATTLDTRLDRDAVRARPLIVTLAQRAQVEILRDGRLLSVETVPAGTQPLDTAALPSGAYDVTLRIVSPAGVREESRFFVKSDALPPADAPSYTLEAGVLAEEESQLLPVVGNTPFLHAGFRYRLGGGLGAGPDLAVSPREAVLSLRALGFWRGIEANADVFAGTDGTAGAGLDARGRSGRVGYAFGVRHIRGTLSPGTIDTRDDDDETADRFVPGRELERITAFAEDTTELDLSLTYQLARGPRVGLRGFWRDGVGRDETYSVGSTLFWPLARFGEARLDLFGEAAATDTESFVFGRLRLSLNQAPWRTYTEAGYRAADDDAGSGALGTLAATRELVDGRDHRLELATRLDRQPEVTSLGSELDYRGTPGRLQLTATHDVEDAETRLAVQAGTTLAVNGHGLGLLGRRGDQSALIARLEPAAGVAPDAVFEVLVDERPRRRLRVGERVAVPLSAYDAYRVRLRQVDGPLAAYDGTVRDVRVYPGTVSTERWQVRALVTVFGRLTDPAGEPLANARLDTEPPITTDASGYFQAELGAGKPTLTASHPDGRCALALPKLETTSGYRRLGDVPCR